MLIVDFVALHCLCRYSFIDLFAFYSDTLLAMMQDVFQPVFHSSQVIVNLAYMQLEAGVQNQFSQLISFMFRRVLLLVQENPQYLLKYPLMVTSHLVIFPEIFHEMTLKLRVDFCRLLVCLHLFRAANYCSELNIACLEVLILSCHSLRSKLQFIKSILIHFQIIYKSSLKV